MTWLWLIVACKEPPPRAEVRAEATPSEHVPSVLVVSVEAEGASRVWVEYGLADAFDLRTPERVGPGDLALLGMKAGRSYLWRAVAEIDGALVTSEVREHTVADLGPGMTSYEVLTEGDDAGGELVLTSIIRLPDGVAWTGILDRDGDWVWWVPASPDRVALTAQVGIDGASIVWGEYDLDKTASGQDVGRLVRVSLDGSERTETRLHRGHHDFIEHDDGTVGYLGLEFEDYTIGTDAYAMASDTILEVAAGAGEDDEPVQVFGTFEDYPYEPDVVLCSHMAEPEYKFGDLVHEWSHGNSLAFVASEDAYYLNAKTSDWLFKVDRATGALLWQLNGPNGDFTDPGGQPVWTGVEDPLLWSHGHLSQVWPGGAMVFDNGDHRTPQVSSLAEIRFDEEAGTTERVWSFVHPDGLHTASMGDVRLLPSDHVLSAWSGLGELMEVTRSGEVVWEARSAEGDTLGRVTPIADLYAPEADIGLPPR